MGLDKFCSEIAVLCFPAVFVKIVYYAQNEFFSGMLELLFFVTPLALEYFWCLLFHVMSRAFEI